MFQVTDLCEKKGFCFVFPISVLPFCVGMWLYLYSKVILMSIFLLYWRDWAW